MKAAKGGKETKKVAKKAAKKKTDLRKITEAVGNLQEALELVSRAIAHIKAAANAINVEMELGLDSTPMSATEAQNHTRPFSPLKVKDIPDPANGSSYTAEELGSPGVFTRKVLASILTQLGGDPVGKMPPALRTAIMEAQGGRSELGTCDFTGDEDVSVQSWEGDDGQTYWYGPKVAGLLAGESPNDAQEILRQVLEGEIEV